MNTFSKLFVAAALSAISFSAAAFPLSFNVTLRDFRGAAAATNPDFNNTNISGLTTGMVASTLDSSGKPVYVGSGGGSNAAGNVFSAASFSAWYRNCDGSAFSCNSQHTVTLTAEVDANDVLNYANNAYFPLDALTDPSIWDRSGAPNHNFFLPPSCI